MTLQLVADARSGKPYIWPTWISGLISGEKHCQWAAWFKAHYHYQKRVDENENALTRWTVEHGEMVQRQADAMRKQGIIVTVEEQNKFGYRGKVAVVGGKPDIIGHDVLVSSIVECKSGRDRGSDFVQLCIYMLLAPKVLTQFEDREVTGLLVYKDRAQRPVTLLDAKSIEESIINQVKRTGSDAIPMRTPSESECRYCDIAGCPDRAIQIADVEPEDGDLF